MASSSSSTPHFFKIILLQTLTQLKLEVPKKFVRKHGEAVQGDEIYLKVANGGKWKVGLNKSDGKVWFEKGWEEFTKFYSFDIGYFLTFRYEGNFCFYVVIFDHSATEIEYSITFKEYDNKIISDGKNKGFQVLVKKEKEEFEENICVKTMENNNNIAQTLLSPTNKRMKIRSDQAGGRKVICKSHEFQKLELEKKEGMYTSELNLDLKANKVRNKGMISRKKRLTTTEEARIMIEKASKFKAITTNPSFMIIMKPSYLHTGNNYPSISRELANTYLKETKNLILLVSDEKVWKICCIQRWCHGIQRFEMTSGWKGFARDNSFKKDDICVFELMKNIQISFKATIFRLPM